MSKLFIHIGLPKTATTTLQSSFFPNIELSVADYVGVKQPRDNIQSEIYLKFINAVNFGENLSAAKEEISGYVKSFGSIIFSEEMILVSQPHATWRKKLSNLSILVNDMDYEIIVTVRQPEAALFSYYVELMPSILTSYRQLHSDSAFLSYATKNESMEIYHYKKLLKELEGLFDNKKLLIVKFEDIIASRMDKLLTLFSIKHANMYKIPLDRTNSRKFSGDYIQTGKVATLGDLIKNKPEFMKFPFRPLTKLFLRYLGKIQAFDINVKYPDKDTFQSLKELLSDDILALKNFSGIDYR